MTCCPVGKAANSVTVSAAVGINMWLDTGTESGEASSLCSPRWFKLTPLRRRISREDAVQLLASHTARVFFPPSVRPIACLPVICLMHALCLLPDLSPLRRRLVREAGRHPGIPSCVPLSFRVVAQVCLVPFDQLMLGAI